MTNYSHTSYSLIKLTYKTSSSSQMNTDMPDALESSTSQTLSNNTFFTPIVFSIAGIGATALAVLFYHLLLVRYCIQRHAARMAALRTFAGEEIPNGVDEKTLATIPIITYEKSGPESLVDQRECTVCLVDIEEGDTVRLLPECKHLFHVRCIDEWFAGHTSCPVCRVPVVVLSADAQPLDDETGCPVCRAVGTIDDEGTSISSDDRTDSLVEGDDGGGVASRPRVVLRHCHSLVLPGEKKGRLTGMELKRSLSMGQSAYVIIDVNIDHVDEDYAYYYSFRDQSIRQFQRLSTKVKESISRMCVGEGQEQEQWRGILPY